MKAVITYEGKDFEVMPDLWANDVAQILTFTVRQANNAVVNLTAGNISFKIKEINTDTNKVDAACTLTNPTGGVCTYTTIAADLDTAGVYDAELEIVVGSSTTTIYLGRFRVQTDLPN
jgi:hypothetical protein